MLLGCYASSRVNRSYCLTLEDGNDRLPRNAVNFPSTLRNIPEERRSLLHRGGHLRSHKLKDYYGNGQTYMALSSLTTKSSIKVMEKRLLKRETENEGTKLKNRKINIGGTNIRPPVPVAARSKA